MEQESPSPVLDLGTPQPGLGYPQERTWFQRPEKELGTGVPPPARTEEPPPPTRTGVPPGQDWVNPAEQDRSTPPPQPGLGYPWERTWDQRTGKEPGTGVPPVKDLGKNLGLG